ncbi:MAG: SDR family NAD(P)-dependent oxidoreductase [Thermodesulfobacteriota bacterium]
MRLKNKIILVTGGSKGIGRGISKVFLAEGANVIICARNEEELKNVENELKNGAQISSLRADLTNTNDITLIKNYISEKYGKLNILVNNASILGITSRIEEYPDDLWNQVIDINLNAQFYITKALIPLLKKTGNGSIINVSSTVGRQGRANWGAYSVSKFGLEALTQILAQELSEFNIRVNSVNPGGTRTDMRAAAMPGEDPNTLPTPHDIAPVFVYLASDESIGETGKEFNARDWIEK